MNLTEAKQELREHGYTLLKEGDMSLEDKIANAKKFNAVKNGGTYKGYDVPISGDTEVWKLVVDWMSSTAAKDKKRFEFEECGKSYPSYRREKLVAYVLSCPPLSSNVELIAEVDKKGKIHINTIFVGGDGEDDVIVDTNNVISELEKHFKALMKESEEFFGKKKLKNDYIYDEINDMALDYLDEQDLDSMLYSQVESSIKNGDMESDFQSEFDDDIPSGDELKDWITNWVDNEIDMCKDDMDEYDED